MSQHSQELRYLAPSELRPDRLNARAHPPAQIKQIVASIKKFGFVGAILADENLNVIAGHGRLVAAQQCNLPTVPVFVLSNLTEAERRALALADNKIALNAGWDGDLLRKNLEIISLELDVELTGFSVGQVDVVLSGPDTRDPDDEVIPAAPSVPTTRRGDIWRCGDHVVGCGDARDRDFVRRVVGAETAAAMFSDPPYNVAINGHAGGKGRIKHAEFAMASGEMADEEFEAFLRDAMVASVEVTREGGVHFVCMDHHHVNQLVRTLDPLYGARLNVCVWNKSNAGMGSLYRSKHELVFVYRVGDVQHRNNVELGRHGRNRTNVWDYPSVNTFQGARRADLALHPTVKPVGLVADAILDVTKRGEIVLDTFLGSGTTLIACERTGRRCRAVEFEPGYVDVALARWSAMTGLRPELIDGEAVSTPNSLTTSAA
ncbi:MAG: DNA methyltransferase [Hyphomonadaceae bacterium]